jgi:hypothetical protein
LSVARAEVEDSAMEVEQAQKQFFETIADLIAANDDIDVLQGLYSHHGCQEKMARHIHDNRSLLQKLNAWRSGAGKWKRIPRELFRIKILQPHLVKLAVDHIRDTTYTSTYVSRVMDLHHGFNGNGFDNIRLVEPYYLGYKRLMRSSSMIK